MDLLSARPYEGREKFITLISAPSDEIKIARIISLLDSEGYRIWFADNTFESTDKIKKVHNKINNCAACIFVISEESSNSHYFRETLNYAVSRDTPIISLFSKQTSLSLGMKMQISLYPQIEQYSLSNSDLIKIVSKINYISSCKKPGNSLNSKCYLERLSNGETIILKHGVTSVGRDPNSCDYVVENNKYIGRKHASFYNISGNCLIIDNNSKNKTYVNARLLSPDEEIKIYDGDTIILANEKFVFHNNEILS